jgi:LPXTG-site transpeptidase (sortase) family protein
MHHEHMSSVALTTKCLIATLAAATLIGACGSNERRDATTELPEQPVATHSVVPPQITGSQPAAESPGAPAPQLAPATPTEPRADGVAYTLHIPSIGVRAPVIAVKSENRVLNPPKDPDVVGWWSDGAMPGDEVGSAILVGHTVSTGGGAFDDVDKLRSGDPVEVANGAGTLTYQVDTVQVLPKGEIANQAETLFDQSVAGRLVLVTCEDWDGKVYHSNVVATAHPV